MNMNCSPKGKAWGGRKTGLCFSPILEDGKGKSCTAHAGREGGGGYGPATVVASLILSLYFGSWCKQSFRLWYRQNRLLEVGEEGAGQPWAAASAFRNQLLMQIITLFYFPEFHVSVYQSWVTFEWWWQIFLMAFFYLFVFSIICLFGFCLFVCLF